MISFLLVNYRRLAAFASDCEVYDREGLGGTVAILGSYVAVFTYIIIAYLVLRYRTVFHFLLGAGVFLAPTTASVMDAVFPPDPQAAQLGTAHCGPFQFDHFAPGVALVTFTVVYVLVYEVFWCRAQDLSLVLRLVGWVCLWTWAVGAEVWLQLHSVGSITLSLAMGMMWGLVLAGTFTVWAHKPT